MNISTNSDDVKIITTVNSDDIKNYHYKQKRDQEYNT